jgi:hypothetical protein
LGVLNFGLTPIWFLVTALLMLPTDLPRLLGYLGLVACADLMFGFVTSVAGIPALSTVAALIAGAVGGPIFWLWLGVLLRREERGTCAAPDVQNLGRELDRLVTDEE